MNIIFIMSDSLRWDHLGYNHNKWIKTPRIDKLAAESNVFNNAFISSYPTVPCRWDILTGKLNYTYAQWQPMAANEVVLPEVLHHSADYMTMLVADTPHILQRGFNYQRGFDAFEWIRGQENDHWKTWPKKVKLPCAAEKLRSPNYTMLHYLRNVAERKGEEDYPVARTMKSAGDWLRRNHDQGNFFLYVDTFSPHEPWDPPKKYVDLYDPGHQGDEITYPQYHPACFFTEAEQKRMRALYAGQVSLVDTWVGQLLDTIDQLGLRENTAVIFTSDHGYMHGEHGFFGKSFIYMTDKEQYSEGVPLFDEISRIPLLVRMPGQTKRNDIDALAQIIDFAPTVLEMGNVLATTVVSGKTMVQKVQCGFHEVAEWKLDVNKLHGQSLMPLIRGESKSLRDMTVSAFPLIYQSPRQCKASIRTREWLLVYCGKVVDPAREKKAPRIQCGKEPGDYQVGDHRTMLFNIQNDPKCTRNVVHEHEDVARDLHRRYVEHLRQKGTPEALMAIHENFVLKPE